ncbi:MULTISPECIES: hypothetical protein [unclassified Streptomyces]|uniref:hypothetical protein n=1 Tax=unclassified Streptomyces TaxID=2593676 RepID=UPI003656D1C7
MHQLTLAKVSLIVLLIPCTGIGLLWVGRRLANRRAYKRFDAADFDPYWAHMKADPGASERAAAAALLNRGLILLDDDGVVRPTLHACDLDRPPGHPVAEHLLEVVRRHGAPATLGRVLLEAELLPVGSGFYRTYEETLPRGVPRRERDREPASCLTALYALFALFTGSFLTAALTESVPRSPAEWAAGLLAATTVLLLAALPRCWRAIRPRPDRTDRLRAYCRSLAPHPELAALDERRTELLDRSLADREHLDPEDATWVVQWPAAY